MSAAAATYTMSEWGQLPIGEDGVSPDVATRLHKLAEREARRLRVPQPVLARTATPSLRAGQVVGLLSVPGGTVEILPKIDGEGDAGVRQALTRMLAVAWGLPIADSEPALLATQRDNLLEVLIRLFSDRLLIVVRRGLPHRYRAREDELTFLRGKLRVHRQFTRHAVRADRVACRFEELSVDTPLNRVFKAAVRRLMSAARSAANVRRLAELRARFEFVGDSVDPSREPVRLDRTNVAFHQLFRLARLLLGGDWQGTAMGGEEGFALLFPMNDLFEVFVGRSMSAALGPGDVRLQHTGKYALESGRGHLFALRPDIVMEGDVVIDTKWKRLTAGKPTFGVAQADVYQMLAYARAYQARRLVLLFPWHEGLARKPILRRWRVAGTATVFDVATVDVAKPRKVASALRKIVARSDHAPSTPLLLDSGA